MHAREEIERRRVIEELVTSFAFSFIAPGRRIRCGKFHELVANRLGVKSNPWLKSRTLETLTELGIRRVVIRGYPYFRMQE